MKLRFLRTLREKPLLPWLLFAALLTIAATYPLRDVILSGSLNEIKSGGTLTNNGTFTNGAAGTVNLSVGTFTPPATMPASSGANLTALNGSNISSGTVADARLDSALARDAEVAAGYVPVTRTVNGQALSGDVTITNITGNAATVTTNANLTGHVISVGNAAVLGSFTVAQLDAAISDANVATDAEVAAGYQPLVVAIINPTVNDDVTSYVEGALWRNTQNTTSGLDDIVFVLTDDTDGAAVWRILSGGIAVTTTGSTVDLTTSSPRLQILTPSADFAWQLPAAGSFVGDRFELIINGGTAYTVTVEEDDGDDLLYLVDAAAAVLTWSGTVWIP